MAYYMTLYQSSNIGYWQKCKAKTLTGAKREATREFQEGFVDGVIQVGWKSDDAPSDWPPEVLAQKKNIFGGKWRGVS